MKVESISMRTRMDLTKATTPELYLSFVLTNHQKILNIILRRGLSMDMRPKELVKSPLIGVLDQSTYVELDTDGLWTNYIKWKKTPKSRRFQQTRSR
jgi:hypothetical protein